MQISLSKKSLSGPADFYRQWIENLLEKADVMINGSRPWDIQVNDRRFYPYLFKKGSLAFGESYMYGLWDCEKLDELMFRILKSDLEHQVPKDYRTIGYWLKALLFNQQSPQKIGKAVRKHYDVGNDLFEAMLDKNMIYSCAYWKDALTLEQAQENKLDLICRKLSLQPGDKVLDIGCGWGGFAGFAARNYGAEVLGVTVSQQQVNLARERCAGLPVEIRLEDYRKVEGAFDKVVSIGMFEHVGYKNYDRYMQLVQKVLKKDGLFLLHCIGGNSSVRTTDPWINTYIFPNAMMPSVAQIGKAIENRFVMEDWHNFGLHYDRTLMEWLRRFKNAWSDLKARYDEHFYRMWVYYLSCCAASFRTKKNNLWQLVLAPSSNLEPYNSIR